jgi:hypothetical protein
MTISFIERQFPVSISEPEERWWLYTMTNAATGNISDRKSWRTALRYALCETPVVERKQLSLFDLEEFKL